MVLFMYQAWRHGVPCIMEHPAPRPSDPTIPSCWYLPELVALACAEGVHTVDIDQCQFGSPSLKPTRLLATHCPALRGLVGCKPRGERCGGRAHVSLQGL
eukprot:6466453-Pyramimonas_sp.AAC.1